MIIGIDASRVEHKHATGVEHYAFSIIEELKKKLPCDAEVILYCRKALTGPIAELPNNWRIKVLPWFSFRFSFWTQIRLSIEMLLHRPDVLFVPAHVYPFIHPKRTVMVIHDIAAARFPESYSFFERWYSLWTARNACKNLWRIIVPSEFTKKELIDAYGADERRIRVARHGFSVPTQTRDSGVFASYGIRIPYIISIGRVEEKKNTRRIVRAFNIVKKKHNVQLVLVGNPGFGFEKVIQEINASTYSHDIIQTGWVGTDLLWPLIVHAQVCVYPSLYEGFGLPILESFAAGTPVVTTRGHAAEEVAQNAAVYADRDNEQEIAEGIHTLLADTDLAKEYVAKGVVRLRDFSWDLAGQQTSDVLLEQSKM